MSDNMQKNTPFFNFQIVFLPESIDPSGVLNGDGLASVINVAVLSNPLVVAGRPLLEGVSILLSKGRAKLSVSHVEPLLLQDPGQAGVSGEGLALGSGQAYARQGGHLEDFH